MTAFVALASVVLVLAFLVLAVQFRGEQRALLSRLDRVDARLDGTLRDTSSRMQNVGQELQAVHDAAGHIQETARSLNRFAEILGTPSARGRLGETILERLLAQVLPTDTYSMQHRFRDGAVVDAVIRTGPALVPIDAKFPLEAYARFREASDPAEATRCWREFARAVKSHTDAVSRYIRLDENTLGFAMMYVPAEAIYYECFVRCDQDDDLQQYALDCRVVAVSPNSFYAYLQSIALGLRGLRVEEQAREILGQLDRLGTDFASFREGFRILGGHLGHAKERYDQLLIPAERLGARLMNVGRAAEAEAVAALPQATD